jgi:hypothetical protein
VNVTFVVVVVVVIVVVISDVFADYSHDGHTTISINPFFETGDREGACPPPIFVYHQYTVNIPYTMIPCHRIE